MQDAMASVIERNERCVVSIARVRPSDVDNLPRPFNGPRNRFGGLFPPSLDQPPKASDPDFIPSEFATGVVVDANGLILTNYHVLASGCQYYITTSDRRVFEAQTPDSGAAEPVWAADPRSDLAILKIDAQDLTPVQFGDASKLRKGHFVIALGNPYAIARDGQPSATWGIVSNLQRKAAPNPDDNNPLGKNTLHHYGTLIQTDARLNLGTSGGMLLNLEGKMVGLTTSLAALYGYEQSAGFAIPVDDTFKRVLDDLKARRRIEYGFLGIQPANLEPHERLQGKIGARVARVEVGTPADRAGLRSNDVIVAVNGTPVHGADGLVLNVGKQPVDAVVRLTVARPINFRTETLQIDVELAKFPVSGKQIFAPEPAWRGVRVDYPTALFRQGFQRRDETALLQGCVAVTEVEPDSPAWRGGLRPGVLITHVNNVRVDTPKAFRAAVEGKAGNVELRRGGVDFGDDSVIVIKPQDE
jgi:serine protease Do